MLIWQIVGGDLPKITATPPSAAVNYPAKTASGWGRILILFARFLRVQFIFMNEHSTIYMTESTITPDQESIQELHLKRITALENENKRLSEEIETLRMEKEDTRAKLVETLISNKKYMREEERLKKENALLRRMPLFLATFVEI